MKNHREKLERLQSWTSLFANTVDGIVPQVVEMLDGKRVPDGGATKEQAAELIWRQIEKRLQEVNAAAGEIRRTFFD